MALASCLPSSTPHWSKLLMFQMTPWVKILCSYIAIRAPGACAGRGLDGGCGAGRLRGRVGAGRLGAFGEDDGAEGLEVDGLGEVLFEAGLEAAAEVVV